MATPTNDSYVTQGNTLNVGGVFSLPPTNSPPVWTTVPDITFSEGVAATASIAPYVSDPDNDPLTLTLETGTLPTGVVFDAQNKQFVYDGSGAPALATGIVLGADDQGTSGGTAPTQQYIPPEIFAVFDGGVSGASQSYVHTFGKIPWSSANWDWKDANGVSQGSNGYMSFSVSTTGPKSFTCPAAMVQLLNDLRTKTKPNWGLLLKNTSISGIFSIRSKQFGSDWATLQLTLADSTQQTLDVVYDVHHIDGISLVGQNTSLSLGTAVLYFDFSSVTQSITAATLTCYVSAVYETGGTVQLHTVDLSSQQAPIPYQVGLANNYDKDVGLANHPDVYFVETFPNQLTKSRGWHNDVSSPVIIGNDPDPVQGHVALYSGASHLKVSFNPVDGGGMSLFWPYYGNTLAEPEEVYFRYYLYLSDTWDVAPEDGKFPGIAGTYHNISGNSLLGVPWRKPDAPAYAGNGGASNTGVNGWSARGGYSSMRSDNPPIQQAGYRELHTYIYNMDDHFDIGANGQKLRWSRGALNFIPKKKWTCIEHYIKMNSIDTSGATQMYYGYPYGELKENTNVNINFAETTGQCQAGSTANTVVLAANSTSSWHAYENCAIWITSRPNEKRLILAHNGTTKTVTIGSLNGSPATWDNIPQAGETYWIQKNIEIRQGYQLTYGPTSGIIYGGPECAFFHNDNSQNSPLADTEFRTTQGIGRKDGIHRVWVNGRLAYERTNLRFRHIPNVQIFSVWLNFYHGGTGIPDGTFVAYITHAVSAKQYIGPMGGL